jgi:putative ABC transport system permease protein
MITGRGQAARELDRELAYHVDQQIAENMRLGMAAAEARAAALRTFGNPALLRDQAQSNWSWHSLQSWLRDIRLGARTLLRSPGFTTVAILVIGLGLGANIALFTVVRGVLIRPLPYPHPEQLVTLYERGNGPFLYNPVAAGSFFAWQRAAHGVQQMAMVSPFQSYNVSAESGRLPEHIEAGWCSWNFFATLGVQPALGRSFGYSDDSPAASSTAILSSSFWRRRYNSDPAIVGKTIWLDARPYTVIGVLPDAFVYTSRFGGNHVQVWTPITHEAPVELMHSYSDHEMIGLARLQPGTRLESVVSQLDAIQHQVKKDHPGPAVHDGAVGQSLLDDAVGVIRTPLLALLAATGCVLLIACMNVAGLLVARSAARAREMAIRAALGGGRWRLARERLIETFLLSGAGGAVGVLIAWAALVALVRMQPDMHRIESIHFDSVVVLFTLAAIALCALFSGCVAAISSEGRESFAALRESSRTAGGSRKRATLRKALLVIEVSLTVVLLAGAGLLLKSYQRLRNAGLGIPTDNVLTLRVSLPEARYKTPGQQVAFFDQLIAQVRALPGIQSAGLISVAPGQGWGGDRIVTIPEHPPLPNSKLIDLQIRGADPGYFAAAQLPILKGRVFSTEERLDRANVVLISRAAANTLFPNEDPIGKHLGDPVGETAGSHGQLEIIGIVPDTRWDLVQPPNATMYVPIFGNQYSGATILVRAAHNVESFAMPIQGIIGRLDPDLPVSYVTTLNETIGKSALDAQFDSTLVASFAIIALILAAAGLYGVLSYLVAQRTAEIGVRMALGAPRAQVLRNVLLDGMRPALLGLICGLVASTAAGRLVATMLYNTAPQDPAIFAGVAATLLVIAAAACLIPAWRASRINPMQALRTE